MPRLDVKNLMLWITAAAVRHPDRLAAHVIERAGVARSTAYKALKTLVELNWLIREGTVQRPRFKPGLLRQVVHQYPLAGLQEGVVWARDFAPFFVMPAPIQRIVHHAFCELVNNAVDHSEGTRVTVSLRQTQSHVQLLVSDDGRGLFNKIHEVFALDDPTHAMLELSKGKLTSQPDRHSGRGLFFTSKLVDVLDLHANEVAYQRRDWDARGWRTGRPLKHQGTSVYAAISLDSTRTLESVLQSHSLDGTSFGFERTTVPLRLITSTLAGLESRSQARQVAARLQQFRCAEMDFDGIDHIGHSFADELFRVQLHQQQGLNLVPINMSPAVAAMVKSIEN